MLAPTSTLAEALAPTLRPTPAETLWLLTENGPTDPLDVFLLTNLSPVKPVSVDAFPSTKFN